MHRVEINLFGLGPRRLNLKITMSYFQYLKAKDEVSTDNYERHLEGFTVGCR